jgi:hypothetical protein
MRLNVPFARLTLIALVVGVSALFIAIPTASRMIPVSRANNSNDNDGGDFGATKKQMKQADQTAHLEAFANDDTDAVVLSQFRSRPALLEERSRLRAGGDMPGVARLTSVLASDAFERAARVTTRSAATATPVIVTGAWPVTSGHPDSGPASGGAV